MLFWPIPSRHQPVPLPCEGTRTRTRREPSSQHTCRERLIRGRRWPVMMGPRSPIIKSGPQAISCGQREVPAAMARLAKVIVPNRVPTLPSRYRNGGYGSGLLVVPDEPDGDPQLSHWHRCIPVGQSIDDRSRLDRAMPRARSRSVNLLYGAKRRSASPKSVACYVCL